MRATVTFKLPNGSTQTLGHGALIGRLWSAELHINDGRISEAHAMVSLRGRDLSLLALRGRFTHKGRTLSHLVLRAQQRIGLAAGLELEVLEVTIPDVVLALEADRVARQVLAGVASLYGGAQPRVAKGWHSDASGYIWPTGTGWMRAADEPIPVLAGDTWEVGGVQFKAVEHRIEGSAMTAREVGFDAALTLIARFDTVHLIREGAPVVVLSGNAARVISELVITGCAIGWEPLARQLWRDTHRGSLRRRWDMLIMRLRNKLRDNGIRSDLLRPDGAGSIQLVLGPKDSVVDET